MLGHAFFSMTPQQAADDLMEPLSSRPGLGPKRRITPLSGPSEAQPHPMLFSPCDPLHLWPNASRHSAGTTASVTPLPGASEHTALNFEPSGTSPGSEQPLAPLITFSLGQAEAVDRYARLPDMPPLAEIENTP